MWKPYNPNPCGRAVGDCAVRAVAAALDTDWETAYLKIVKNGFEMCDMPSGDAVWGAVLRQNGFVRKSIPNTCPMCYTVADFARDHPKGTYTLALGGHVVTVNDGDWLDSWDSGRQIPQYYWTKE